MENDREKAMLNGLSENQIKELNTDLAKLPPCFNEIKKAILSGSGYWYPLSIKESAMKPVAYSLDRLYRDNRIDLIESIIAKAGIADTTCFHPYWHEHSRDSKWRKIPDMKSYLYEKDDTGYCFPWLDEVYYFDESESWIIYVSHEGTITFAGEHLSEIAETVIPAIYKDIRIR